MLTFFVAVALVATPIAAGQPDSGPDYEEYAIYSVVINDLKMIDEDYILINDHTTVDKKPFTPTKKRLYWANKEMRGGIPAQLQNDFETKNRSRYRLDDHFNINVKKIFLSQAEIDKLVSGGDWIDFLKKYPGHGIIEFSRVGFNARRDRAFVYAGSQGGPKSGAGFYLLLSKTGGHWVVDQKIFAWLS